MATATSPGPLDFNDGQVAAYSCAHLAAQGRSGPEAVTRPAELTSGYPARGLRSRHGCSGSSHAARLREGHDRIHIR